jgi:predicted RNase H-like HicB family nuclease
VGYNGRMAKRQYTVVFVREDDGGYHASVPALCGCHTQGDTLEEATENIREAIALYVECLGACGDAVPSEELVIQPVEVDA